MRKFIIIAGCVVALAVLWNICYYRLGWYIDLNPNQSVSTFMTADSEKIYMDRGSGPEEFTIKAIDLDEGIPGEWETDYAIDHDTYYRWLGQIQDVGANTVRVYTILNDDFYNAFDDYNNDREEAGEEPLYLIQGVWVNDYTMNSHRDAFDEDFLGTFLDDCRTMVDVLHGNVSISLGRGLGSGSFRRDVSKWVIGYILGSDWEARTVAYTNEMNEGMEPYQGTYFCAREDATPFESMLAQVLDKTAEYGSERYKEQKLMAFSNWADTDPFVYTTAATVFYAKCAHVDAERIVPTENFISGYFASYHAYPYYPDYLDYIYRGLGLEDLESVRALALEEAAAALVSGTGTPYTDVLDEANYYDGEGEFNTYYAYLTMLNAHHTHPVVIAEFGTSTGRGMSRSDYNTGRNQGNTSESEQGDDIVETWEDIIDSGCAGGCLFSWQDVWAKRTWNTIAYVDISNSPYWSDAQTSGQFFGLLTFDPGEDESVCYVDGNTEEWTDDDVILETGDMTLSMKYDEKYLYFYVDGVDPGAQTLYLPIDTTPKTGSTYSREQGVAFSRACDFLMIIDGQDNSRVLVQERYEALRAVYSAEVYMEDTYEEENIRDVDTPSFVPIRLVLNVTNPMTTGDWDDRSEIYETGILRYGNANPESDDFDSLADFFFTDNGVEIRLPWQLLNFSNPSEMTIHDDYYEHYGIENLTIDEMYVGLGTADTQGRLPMGRLGLQGWGTTVTYHERLKSSYYVLQEAWSGGQE